MQFALVSDSYCILSFFDKGHFFITGTKPAKYWIVDTDYENFSLVWSCEDVEGLISLELAWVLSRKRTLDANTVSKLKKELEQYGVKINRFVDTDQSNCPK